MACRQARNGGSRRLVEVLLREVLDVLQLPPRRLHHAKWHAVIQRPGHRLRLHLDRLTGKPSELDEQHRPQRRLRHPGSRVPGNVAVQRVLGEPAPERRHRRRLQRRPWAHVDGGQPWEVPESAPELNELEPRRRCRQAVDRGEPHRGQSLPGPRLRDVGRVQRRQYR